MFISRTANQLKNMLTLITN